MYGNRTALTRVEKLEGVSEAPLLFSGKGTSGQFGLSQVRHQARKPELRRGTQVVERGRPVAQFQAGTAHAGVQFDDDLQRLSCASPATAQPDTPGCELPEARQHRRRTPANDAVQVLGRLRAAEQQDAAAIPGVAELLDFGGARHRQSVDAEPLEFQRHGGRAVAVGVRLDDSVDRHLTDRPPHRAKVDRQGAEIDLDPRAWAATQFGPSGGA